MKRIAALLAAAIITSGWGFFLTVGGSPPTNTVLPVVSSSSPVVGTPETTTNGTWANSPTGYAYQWKWGDTGATIGGATSSSYTPVSGDVGHTLTATVTASNAFGSASATSAATSAVTAGGTGDYAYSLPNGDSVHYLAPSGCSNSYNGLSPTFTSGSNGPWCNPTHAMNCGDVIIASAGTYSPSPFGNGTWGAVSNCPSTTGGIDGTGGVYFAVLLCAGPSVGSCSVVGGSSEGFRLDASNWAIEGFTATQNTNGNAACYSGTSENATTLHHLAFINDIASTCHLSGFDTYAWTSPGGVDQTAVVGAISYNGSPSVGGGLCSGGVSMIPTNGPDTSSGTHVIVAGYFGYKNINAPSGAGCNTDGEGVIFDSWACGPYLYQGVAEQNVWWLNGTYGFQVFPNCNSKGDKVKVYVFNNTSYGNGQDPTHNSGTADLYLHDVLPTVANGTYYSVTNNIFESTMVTSGNNGTATVWAAGLYIDNSNTSLVNVSGNYIWQSNPGTTFTAGPPNTDVWVGSTHNPAFPFGTNTYNNPGMANPGALPTTAPNCSGYTNTTDCMNTGYGVAAKIAPSGGAVGVGYNVPGPCAPDPYYPTWLKGVVYLQWDSGAHTITEKAGLLTKPCGL